MKPQVQSLGQVLDLLRLLLPSKLACFSRPTHSMQASWLKDQRAECVGFIKKTHHASQLTGWEGDFTSHGLPSLMEEGPGLNSPRFEAKQGGSHLLLGLLFSQLPRPLLGRERRESTVKTRGMGWHEHHPHQHSLPPGTRLGSSQGRVQQHPHPTNTPSHR